MNKIAKELRTLAVKVAEIPSDEMPLGTSNAMSVSLAELARAAETNNADVRASHLGSAAKALVNALVSA